MHAFARPAALAAIFLLCLCPAAAMDPSETRADVPALFAFHEVIARIWHEAWPAKDVKLLAALKPDVDKGIAAVAAAELPGILRERQPAWTKGVADLQAIGTEYGAAIAAKDDARLLAAAERLHGQFETLVRIVRPRVKEMQPFHEALYRVWHVALPAGDMAAVRAAVPELQSTMAALDKAVLNQRQAPKQAPFDAARADLSKAVAALAQPGDDAALRARVEAAHAAYMKLEAVFD
jgi:hypothetical protein